MSCFPGQSRSVFNLLEQFKNLGVGRIRGQSSCSVERAVSSRGAEQTRCYCGSCNKNGILFHFSYILSQQMTARHRSKTKYYIEEILNPAANNWLHFSRYWLLSRSCLGKDTEYWFMTAHRNTESSQSCSEHISILLFLFSHKHCYLIPQIKRSRLAQSYTLYPLGQEGR